MSEGILAPERPTPVAPARRIASVPVEACFLALGMLVIGGYHFIQALRRSNPWIFPDEVRYTEFARAVAETGIGSVAGERPTAGALQSYLLAPAWLFDDPGTSFAVAKLIQVCAFCVTAVPVYLLARRFTSRHLSIAAAASTLLLPAAFYSGTLMQEPIALPIAATVVLLTVRLLERFSWTDTAWLGVACAAGIGARGQLVVLPVIVATAIVIDAAASRLRGRRVDLRALALGMALLVIACVAFGLIHGASLLKDGLAAIPDDPAAFVEVIVHSAGATTVGVAVIPVVALLALPRLAGAEERSVSAFASTGLAATLIFLAYAGLKSASQGYVFITLVEERNLIYLQPIAIVAVTVVASRVGIPTLAASTAVVFAALVALPIVDVGSAAILSENPGMSWVWHLRDVWTRDWETPLTIALLALAAVGAAVLRRRGPAAVALIACGVLTAFAGVFSYRGDQEFARNLGRSWLSPSRDWVDRAIGASDSAVLLIDKSIPDRNGLYLLTFWNRAIRSNVVVDGAATPGIAGSADVATDNGSFPTRSARHAVSPRSIGVEGSVVEQSPHFTLVRLERKEGRIATKIQGLWPDGWVERNMQVIRLLDGPPGNLMLDLSTLNSPGTAARTVEARIGGGTHRWTIPLLTQRTIGVSVPRGPFVAKFKMSPGLSPGTTDFRRLSLQVSDIRIPPG
jgi:hypothetical protein